MRTKMQMEIRSILDFIRDHVDAMVISLGIFSIFIALLLLTRVYQYVSSVMWLFGVSLIIVGTALHFEPFQLKVPSRKGFGTLLMYISGVFMAATVVATIFGVPTGLLIRPSDPWHPRTSSSTLISMSIERPYVWLAAPLMFTGLGILAFGFLLRFANDIF